MKQFLTFGAGATVGISLCLLLGLERMAKSVTSVLSPNAATTLEAELHSDDASAAWELMALARLDDVRFAERSKSLGDRAPQLALDAIRRKARTRAREWALECVRRLAERETLPAVWKNRLHEIAKACHETASRSSYDGGTALRAFRALEALAANPRTRRFVPQAAGI